MRLAAVLLSVVVASPAASAAEADCWDSWTNRQISINGKIKSVGHEGLVWSIATSVKADAACAVVEIFGEGLLPTNCTKDRRFMIKGTIAKSATMVQEVSVDPTAVDSTLSARATTVSCQ
jgi:hypothetical protein